ncbi:hypothetical protein ABPG72_018988 [Tetrahymena utriculariae]
MNRQNISPQGQDNIDQTKQLLSLNQLSQQVSYPQEFQNQEEEEKKQSLNQQKEMNKQNISPQGQQNIDQTKQLLSLNQLSQQVSHPQEFQNQEEVGEKKKQSLNQQKEMNKQNISPQGQDNIDQTKQLLSLNQLSQQVSYPQEFQSQEEEEKKQSLNQQKEMNKQNISPQGQDKIDQTKQLLSLNQLSQQISHPQEFQNQEGYLNIQNELEDKNIFMSSEQTLKREIKSQIVRKSVGQNRIFQQAICQVMNQKETQHAIISYQNQEDMNTYYQLSSKNQNKQKFQSQNNNCQLQEKTDIILQKEVKHQNKQLALNHEQIADQLKVVQLENTENKSCSLSDFIQKESNKEQKQITKYPIYDTQKNCKKLKQLQEKIENSLQKNDQQLNKQKTLKNEQAVEQANFYQQEDAEKNQSMFYQQDQQIYEEQKIIQQPNIFEKSNLKFKQNTKNLQKIKYEQEFEEKQSKNQNNNEYDQIHQNYQQKQNIPIQQEIQSVANQQKLGILKNSKNLNNISKRYFFQLKKIFDETEAYQYTDYERKVEIEHLQVCIIKRQWEPQIFERINASQIQNEIFQSQKQKIFESLIQKQYYPCKIINSNKVEDIIIGFFQDENDNFDKCENLNEYIFKIIYNSVQSNIDSQNKIFKTLGFQFELIILKQQKISIFIITKNDFLSISQKFEQLVDFKQNILQIENNYEINSLNFKACKKCGHQKNCESYNCFKNIKSRILDFLQSQKKYSYCEYENKLINGIIFQLSEKELISEYLNFVHKTIFANQQEDIFIGYQEEIKEKYIDYIFVIKYNPNDSEIQKYYLVKQFNEEFNYFIVNSYVHIFVITKDTFFQIYNNFEQQVEKKEFLKKQNKMNKQNISSEGQDNIIQTKNLFSLNQLSQQILHPQQFQNSEYSPVIQSELDGINISMSSEQTLKRQIKSQIIRRHIGENRVFSNAMCQIINQHESQHVIVSYQNQQNNKFFQYVSSKNSNGQNCQLLHQCSFQQGKNDQENDLNKKEGENKQMNIIKESISNNKINCLSFKHFQEKTDIDLEKCEQQHKQEQIPKYEQISDQEHVYHQKNTEIKVIQLDKYCKQNDFSKKEEQDEQKQVIKQLISDNQIDCFLLKEFYQNINHNIHKDDQQHNKQQNLNHKESNDQENNERIQNLSQQQEQQYFDEQKTIHQSDQTQESSIFNLLNISQLSNQFSQDRFAPLQPKQFEKSTKKLKPNEKDKKQQQLIPSLLEIVEQPSKAQSNSKDYLISQNDQYKHNYSAVQLEIQSSTNAQQFEIFKNLKKQNNLQQSYFFQLKKIFDEIKAYQYTEYEKEVELGQSVLQIKKVWEQSIFEDINGNQVQSKIFLSQKQKIFKNLIQKQFYPCKIVTSDQTAGLIIGFFKDEYEDFDEYIFKIIQNSDQQNIYSLNQIINTLGIQFELIKLQEENITILILAKNDFLSIQQNFEYLVYFKQNIQQFENFCEINSQNCCVCSKCEQLVTCENFYCFKNIKSRILTFLQNKKYSYCQYQNKLIEGIIFQLSQEKIIQEYLKFFHQTIFSTLENNQIDEQNSCDYQSSQFCENNSEKKQNFSLEQNNEQFSKADLINEYSFKDYLVQKASDQNQEKSQLNPHYQRDWNINIFNALNKNQVSDTFQKMSRVIIQVLKTKKYFLCKCFISDQSEDIFIGYQEEIKENYKDYIFVIKYNPNDSEIQKYLFIKPISINLQQLQQH